MLREVLAATATAVLVVWVVSVAGVTGWGPSVNWPLLLVGVALLAARLPRRQ
ncbi:MAG TPA: hypothetical protein VJP39_04580 [Gaiellaceae bacterium]|nr:hypothetical protein [Gaiellaceae bacterium]